MKREDVNLFISALKIVFSNDIEKLFKKTELVSGVEGEESAVYARKYNKNIEIIKTAINKEDDDTELFLICLKSAISDLNPSLGDTIKIGNIFNLNTDSSSYLPFSKTAGVNETKFWSSDNTQDLAIYSLLSGGKGVHITKIINTNALWWSNYNTTTVKGKQYYKVTGVTPEKQIMFGNEGNKTGYKVIADHDDVYEVNWDLNLKGSTRLMNQILTDTNWKGDCDITITQVPEYVGNLKSYLFCTKFKNILDSFTPNENDLKYCCEILGITIED